MSLMNEIKNAVRGGASPEVAVDDVLARASREDLAEVVRPLAVHEAKHFARGLARRLERSAFLPPNGSAIRRLAGETFLLSTGRRVSWGEATVEDHLARAALKDLWLAARAEVSG